MADQQAAHLQQVDAINEEALEQQHQQQLQAIQRPLPGANLVSRPSSASSKVYTPQRCFIAASGIWVVFCMLVAFAVLQLSRSISWAGRDP